MARSGCRIALIPSRNDFERIDVETGIRLVQNREPRLQQHHLQNFVALLFTARKSFVHRTLEHCVVQTRVGLRNVLQRT